MNNRALYWIIEKVSEIKPPGKKALQKIVYLIQRKGVELDYPFSIHYYGPYSSALDYSVQSLSMSGAVEIKQSGFSSLILPTKISEFIFDEDENIPFSDEELKLVETVIKKFANHSPKDLELLTTTDFVANEILRKKQTIEDQDIIKSVQLIKGDKFSETQINKAISELRSFGYLS